MAHPQPDGGRDRVANPNHHHTHLHSPPPLSSASAPSGPAAYQPPASVPGPPPRQPPFDPFRARDPFLPPTSIDKRDGRPSDLSHPDIFHHAPAPPQSPFHLHSSTPMKPFKEDHHRSKSYGSSYDPHGHPPPPPPPQASSSSSILNRQMPPPPPSSAGSPVHPSSRPHTGHQSPPPQHHAPLAHSYGQVRESSNPSSKHRPSSSMSIQSMMGPDGATPAGPPPASQRRAWSPYGAHNAPSAAGAWGRPSSPYRDGNQARPPQTPERRYESLPPAQQSYQPAQSQAHGSQSPISYPASQTHPSEPARTSLSQLTQPVYFSPHNKQPAPNSGLPPRPFSQPAEADAHPDRVQEHDRNGHVPPQGPTSTDHRDRFDRPASRGHADARNETNTRDRALSDQDARRDAYADQRYHRYAADDRQFAPIGQPMSTSASHTDRKEPQYGEIRRDRFLNQTRPPPARDSYYPLQADTVPPDTSGASQHQPSAFSQPHFDSSRFPASATSQPSDALAVTESSNRGLPTNGSVATDNLERATPTRTSSFQSITTPNIDTQLRRSIEETQAQHRAIIGIGNDRMKRLDRGSPLPQAVQGAQAQPAGSGRDPNIKSEFGRMFSGLGSGIGSTPQPLTSQPIGHPPSGRQSPLNPDDLDPGEGYHRRLYDSEAMRRIRSASRTGRRGGKRAYDDDMGVQLDNESLDGRTTPVPGGFGARNGKKSKTSLAAQGHHHHHPLGHHHHHHHHHHHRKPEDDVSAPFMVRRTSGTPFNSLRFASSPQPSPNSNVPHHHHLLTGPHHHHHHHHPPPVRSQPIRRPITTIKTNALLQSLSHMPRKHLGSQLYAPTVTTPSPHAFSLGSTHMFATTPNALPQFDREKHSNCTFTVRVPRYYLTHHSREAICADRRLWGTDVYTDDSDPIAASIHGGWMRGAWGDEVDVGLLLELSEENSNARKKSKASKNPPIESTNQNKDGDGKNVESVGEQAAGDKDTSPHDPAASEDSIRAKKDQPQAVRAVETPPPSGPVDPPQDLDLHITLLMLPPLEKYTSAVWHGVKSRSWGDNHDGMSFKVLKLEFVDEGLQERYEERHQARVGGKAASRHKKLDRLGLFPAPESTVGRPLGNTPRAVHGPTFTRNMRALGKVPPLSSIASAAAARSGSNSSSKNAKVRLGTAASASGTPVLAAVAV